MTLLDAEFSIYGSGLRTLKDLGFGMRKFLVGMS